MIEFIEDGHIYLKDGIIVPSVSEILSFIFPEKYKGIPKKILNAKAEYGTIVHLSIETYEKGEEMPKLNLAQELSFQQYLQLKEEYNITPIKNEVMINYKYDFCGRLDMIAIVDGAMCLLDIKTTAECDLEYLSWQLSLYEYAYIRDKKNKRKENFDDLYCIWLPKGNLAKLIKVKRKTKKEIEEKIGEFKKWKKLK